MPKRPGELGYTRVGEYVVAADGTVNAGIAANSEVFQFRWAPTNTALLCVLREIFVSAGANGTAFAASSYFELYTIRSTAWTADGTGGAALSMTTTGKQRTNMPNSSLQSGGMRICTSVALGAGSKTLDPLGMTSVSCNTDAGGAVLPLSRGGMLLSAEANHPLVLAVNEGFSLLAIVPATGTWKFTIQMRWDETAGYPRG